MCQMTHSFMPTRSLHCTWRLLLGDVALLDTDITGVEQRLTQEGMPTGMLTRYLRAYCQVAEEQLDERGDLILAWLRRITSA